jgi:hypothetical protein
MNSIGIRMSDRLQTATGAPHGGSRTETGVGGSPESLIPEPDGVGCMIEIQICCDTDPEVALENTCFWAPLWLMAEHRTNVSDSLDGGRRPGDDRPVASLH